MTPEECVICERSWMCQGKKWFGVTGHLGRPPVLGKEDMFLPATLPLDSGLAYEGLAESCQEAIGLHWAFVAAQV